MDMKKAVLTAALALGCACGTQAYVVTENFGGVHPSRSLATSSVEYQVVVGAGESLTDFTAGIAVAPMTVYARDSLGSNILVSEGPLSSYAGWMAFVADGATGPGWKPSPITAQLWSVGPGLAAGTYYFGYTVPSATYNLIEVSANAYGTPGGLLTLANNPVNSGNGPIHAIEAVPEPAAVVLLGLGTSVMVLRRRRG